MQPRIMYHEVTTEDGLCKNGDGKPVHGAKDECQACYRRTRRLERGLQKPGPKPDPSKPFSRHNNETSHHNRRIKCKYGHLFDGVDGSGKQTCSTCTEINKNKTCPAGHDPIFKNKIGQCKECGRLRQPHVNRKVKYGLTPEKLQEMMVAQDFACAICHTEFDLDKTYPFCVDHDHSCCPGEKTCGKCVRELLCGDCNRLLGAAKDSTDILRAAILYLSSWETS